MMKTLHMLAILFFCIAALPASLSAQNFGTPEEAKAMLEHAVKAVEDNEARALNDFTEGKAMFKEKDLYVFCFDAESGVIRAHGAKKALVGKNARQQKDKTGYALGEALFNTAAKGEFREVSYLWPRPGEEESSQKSTYITKVNDLSCGVGYYK